MVGRQGSKRSRAAHSREGKGGVYEIWRYDIIGADNRSACVLLGFVAKTICL